MSRRSLHRSALAVLLVALLAADALAQPPPPQRGAEGTRPPCVEARGEARMQAYGWNHVVVVRNGCDAAVECRVSTDVDPGPIVVRVAPGQTHDTLVRRDSPASRFVARADCETR